MNNRLTQKKDPFLEKLDDINSALTNGSYQSALALALTIPDICSKLAATHKHKYAEWFDDYVSFGQGPTGWPGVKFDGKTCFDLRNAFLHAGNIDLKDKKGNPIKFADVFSLCVNGASKLGGHQLVVEGKVQENVSACQIDIGDLCTNIMNGAKKFYEQKKDVYDFSYVDPKIEDYKKEHNENVPRK